ncbi:MAG TPA: helix-hairpin-helix domain-containing protein [Chitinophagaceae bacterium]|nr:helix-hairpin-helix domain-containing protein [Chitinophagaceae bacterium]
MWRDFIKDYFSFTAKERKGIIIIISIILLVLFLPLLLPYFNKKVSYNHSEFEKEITQLKTLKNDSPHRKIYNSNYENGYVNDYSLSPGNKSDPIAAEVFYFDPNTASASDWRKLGIRDKTIKTIQNYISKGGKFYKPEDISKIWGLPPSDVQRLVPYVRISLAAKENASFEKKEYPKPLSPYSPKTIQPVDINLADTSAYISLPGIGSKLSKRIISFRDKLGGFYSIDQVGETYLLPDSTFQKIKPRLILSNTPVKKININTATVDEMKTHPYLRYNLANAIFQYRQQHGNFNSVGEIKKIMIVTEEIFIKLSPYLSIE